MAVADYVTRQELEDMLMAMERRIMGAMVTKADLSSLRSEIIEAIQRGPSANF